MADTYHQRNRSSSWRGRLSSIFTNEDKKNSQEVRISTVSQPSGSLDGTNGIQALGHELTEENARQATGFAFPVTKKWAILCSIFIVQISMNFNASIYGNAIHGLTHEFQISEWTARLGQVAFLVMYAFGCEAWAPWSEELGRKWVLNCSLGLVNLTQIGCALAPTFGQVVAFRILGGLFSAGGSVTLGIVADMWTPKEQQYAVNFVVLSSVAGSVFGPVIGCFIQEYLNWRWVFWISLFFGGATQFVHLFTPETNCYVLLDREAKRRRKTGEDVHAIGPLEKKGSSFWQRLNFKETVHVMFRPYKFLITEPIVCFLSLFSGFADALIFSGLESFPMILKKWNFGTIATGLSFATLLVGYLTCWAIYQTHYYIDRKRLAADPHAFDKRGPERRLKLLLTLGLMFPLGLLGLGFASLGPPGLPWIVPLICVVVIGIANYAIYQATIDYMIAAYGHYSASATGGNGFCRDFLAGMAALYTTRFYKSIGYGTRWQLAYPTFILCAIGLALNVPVWLFYFYGPRIRAKSPYAHQLEMKREEVSEHGGDH